MGKASITFFVLGLVAMLFGAYGIAGVSIEMGKTLLMVFIALAVLSFILMLGCSKPSNVSNTTEDKNLKKEDLILKIKALKDFIRISNKLFDESFNTLTMDSKICNIAVLSASTEKLYENRKIIKLPDNKYQILVLSDKGLVKDSTDMGIVDTFEEVRNYIRKADTYIILG